VKLPLLAYGQEGTRFLFCCARLSLWTKGGLETSSERTGLLSVVSRCAVAVKTAVWYGVQEGSAARCQGAGGTGQVRTAARLAAPKLPSILATCPAPVRNPFIRSLWSRLTPAAGPQPCSPASLPCRMEGSPHQQQGAGMAPQQPMAPQSCQRLCQSSQNLHPCSCRAIQQAGVQHPPQSPPQHLMSPCLPRTPQPHPHTLPPSRLHSSSTYQGPQLQQLPCPLQL
jgi:hypothetical protein